MQRRLAAVPLSLALAACNLSADVNNTGGYTLLPGAPVADTAALPLRHLLVVERDAGSERTLVYYFEGELAAAGLGLEDLRRKALRHGGYQLRFAYPPARYASAFEPSEQGALRSELDGEELAFSPLDGEALYLTGASRFLRSVDDAEYPVRAYFAAVERAGELGTLRIELAGEPIEYDFALGASGPAPRVVDGTLAVERAETERAGELELELSQDVVRISDEAELETSVVTLLAPDAPYAAPAGVVLAAFAGNCWSLERPLVARLSQIRQYYARRDGGDFAVIERRRDAEALRDGELASFVDEHGGAPELAAYCNDIH